MFNAIWTLIRSLAVKEEHVHIVSYFPKGNSYITVKYNSSDVVLSLLFQELQGSSDSIINKIIILLEIAKKLNLDCCLYCQNRHFEYDDDRPVDAYWEELWQLLEEKGIRTEPIKNFLRTKIQEIKERRGDECGSYDQYSLIVEIAKQLSINLRKSSD